MSETVTVRHKATGLEWQESPEQARTKSPAEFEILETNSVTEETPKSSVEQPPAEKLNGKPKVEN